MKTTAIIEKGKDGTYGIYSDNLKSVIHASGSTVTEAKANFAEVLQEAKDISNELHGAPNELSDITFEYKYDMASMFNFLDWLNISKVANRIGINRSLLSAYKTNHAYISEKQAKKIEEGLHELAGELMSVSVLI